MISARYAPALCVVLALALVPTVIHSYVGAVVTDRLATSAIPATLAGYASAPSGRDAGWGGRRFDSTDWIERAYTSPGDEVVLTVLRSYDLKKLYHHPELDVAYGTPFLRQETRRFGSNPDIPVHVLYSDTDRGSIVVYVLHYDGGFVADPLMFQLRTASDLLFSGRKPMTLLFARDLNAPSAANVESLPVVKLLFAAVEQFTHGGS